MNSPALFQVFKSSQIPFVSLIQKPTSVHPLAGISKQFPKVSLYAKREDETDSVYGGNKVRNLEFILGVSQKQGVNSVHTLAPLGSNFIAALAAQSQKLGIKAHVEHFTPAKSPQILSHWRFSQDKGILAHCFSGRQGVIPAGLMTFFHHLQGRQWISPGGSSALGALGHVNAALELAMQLEKEKIPAPDVVYVGAGTCGTLAGLNVGFRIAGLKTQVIGVRCVDALVCHSQKVARLANGAEKLLGIHTGWKAKDIRIVNPKMGVNYGVTNSSAKEAMDLFSTEEGIRLDTTYTSKVASHLLEELKAGHLDGKNVLYWHTFSPKALCYSGSESPSRVVASVREAISC